MGWTETFVAGLHRSTKVLSTGVLVDEAGRPHPAVMTRSLYGQEWVWAPTGRKGANEGHSPASSYNEGWTLMNGRVVQLEESI